MDATRQRPTLPTSCFVIPATGAMYLNDLGFTCRMELVQNSPSGLLQRAAYGFTHASAVTTAVVVNAQEASAAQQSEDFGQDKLEKVDVNIVPKVEP